MIVGIAKAFELVLVAEGIETAMQAKLFDPIRMPAGTRIFLCASDAP